jgi:pSer/pThr/pTyr-binding forkhead associated (FHA) protein
MIIKLLVLHGRPQGKSLLFPLGEFVIGRGAECHVRPNSDWVSRQHCLLRVAEDGVVLRDLGSRNGTLVNGTRVKGECRLADGDKLQIGPLVFQLAMDGSAREGALPDASARETQEINAVSATTQEMQIFTPQPPTAEVPALETIPVPQESQKD